MLWDLGWEGTILLLELGNLVFNVLVEFFEMKGLGFEMFSFGHDFFSLFVLLFHFFDEVWIVLFPLVFFLFEVFNLFF